MSNFQEQLKANAARKYDDETLKRELDRIHDAMLRALAEKMLSELEENILKKQRNGEEYKRGSVLSILCPAGLGTEPVHTFGLSDFSSMRHHAAYALSESDKAILADGKQFVKDYYDTLYEGSAYNVLLPRIDFFEGKEQIVDKHFLFLKWKKARKTICFSKRAKVFLAHLHEEAQKEGISIRMLYRIVRHRDRRSLDFSCLDSGHWDLDYMFPLLYEYYAGEKDVCPIQQVLEYVIE